MYHDIQVQWESTKKTKKIARPHWPFRSRVYSRSQAEYKQQQKKNKQIYNNVRIYNNVCLSVGVHADSRVQVRVIYNIIDK